MSDVTGIAGIIIAFGVATFIIVVTVFGSIFLQKISDSWIYRRLFVDLYVVAKIKKLAKDESLDLGQEQIDFLKHQKLQYLSLSKLDQIVESELAESITKNGEKK